MKINGMKLVQDRFGDPRRAAQFLKNYGVTPPGEATIQKWRQRGVGDSWVLLLACFLEIETGAPVLPDFLEQ